MFASRSTSRSKTVLPHRHRPSERIVSSAVKPIAESLERRMLLSVSASMVADINTATASSGVSSVADLGNGKAVFFATDGFHGEEPFITDGTAAGTTLIKDIDPGPAGSQDRPGTAVARHSQTPVVANGRSFFDANDGVDGHELWITDGTAAGTTLVKDINPGSADSNPQNMVVDGNIVFFTADDGTDGRQLWKSDGTSAGTSMVVPVGTFPNGPGLIGPVFNGRLFFTANDGVHGYELWSTDGTAAGTAMVADINPDQTSSAIGSLTVSGSQLFFTVANETNVNELWATDGASAGTHMVADLPIGIAPPDVQDLADVNGTLFFEVVVDSVTYLYKSDGTSAGTVQVFTFNANSAVSDITDYGGRAYFEAADGVNDSGLWQSDGTTAGTTEASSLGGGMLTVAGPNMFFAATDGQGGLQLYVINSVGAAPTAVSPPGSVRLNDPLGNPHVFEAIGSGVYFYGISLTAGSELWHSDGTAAGTGMVDDINTTTVGSSPSQLTEINGRGVFAANDTIHGIELWATDGSAGGTTLLKDIVPGPDSGLGSVAYPPSFTPARLGNYCYFVAGAFGQIWRTDGTVDGTTLCLSFLPESSTTGSLGISQLTAVNGSLYFFANDGTGSALYISDGTPSGTTRLQYLNPPSSSGQQAESSQFSAVGNQVVFAAADSAHGTEPWVTDGTPAGTMLLKDINSGTTSSLANFQGLQRFVNFGSAAYFTAKSQTGLAIWRTDGTVAGTSVVEDFSTNANISSVDDLTPFNGKVYFSTGLKTGGGALWTSDGTSTGTALIENFPASGVGAPTDLTVVGNTLFFSAPPLANTGPDGLYASDGTAAGTILVAGTGTGQAGFYPVNVIDVQGTVYFIARDQGAYELWRVDQAQSGGISSEEIWPAGPSTTSSYPTNFAALDGTFFFQATDQAHGAELWKLNLLQANAGGPYLATGSTVPLDASASRDPNASYPLTYSWDLDGDGTFGETGLAAGKGNETGVNPSFYANQNLPGVYPVTVQVTGSWQNTATATSYVSVPPHAYFGGDTVTFTLGTAVTNASIQSWNIDWGDGTPVENYAGGTTSVSHMFAIASGTSPFMVQISPLGASGAVEPLPIPVTVYADPVLNNGSLYLTGTSGDDVAFGSNPGTLFEVGLNGAVRNYNSSLISRFIYTDGGGDDQINLRDSVFATLNLSTGNDWISNAGATATVNAGTGKIRFDSSFGTTTFTASNGSGIRQLSFSSMNVSGRAKIVFANSSATLGDYSNHSNRSVVVVDAGGLNILSGGTLDLGDNDLILNYDPTNRLATRSLIAGLVASGYGTTKNFSGTGLTSSEANYDATQSGGTRAIGWGDNADLGKTSFDGVTLSSPNEMLVKFTYYGDCNLDGIVDTGPDLSLFAKGFHGQGSGWDFGDFNYDGLTNNLDLSLYSRGLNSGYKTYGAL